MAKGSRFSWATMALAAVSLAGGCRSQRDPIQALLSELEAAAEARDAAAIEAKLTGDFRAGNGMPRGEVRGFLQRYFFAYESINLEVYDVEVERGGDANAAHARFATDFNGRPKSIGALGSFLPPSAVYRFDLDLRETEKGWQVSGAAWEDLTSSRE